MIAIRPTGLGDEIALQARCFTANNVDEVRRQVEWAVSSRGAGVLEHFVAEFRREVVGTVMLWMKGSHAAYLADGSIEMCRLRVTQGVGSLGGWVVSGEHQGHGVGTALARAVIEEARRWGLLRLESSSLNPGAVAALKKVGFVEYGRLPLLANEEPAWHGGTAEVMLLLDLAAA